MTDPPDPCPPAHLPPERLAALGLLTPFLCGAVVCSFIFLPPSCACVIALVVFVWMKAEVTVWWAGFNLVQLQFRAVDACTGQPIQGAKAVVFMPTDTVFMPTDTGPLLEACTGPDGVASVIALCWVVVERGLFGTSSFPCLERRWFKVTAAGYEGTGWECLALYTVWHKGGERPDPPPIRAELERLPLRTGM